MIVQTNQAYIPLFNDPSTYIVLKGSAGSGKSVFCADYCITRSINEPGIKILVARKYATTLRSSVFALLKARISAMGYAPWYKYNETNKTITNTLNGSEISCTGLDDVEKLKSISQVDVIWCEEATEITLNDFNQLDTRMRGEREYRKQMLLSFNPTNVNHWIKNYFFDSEWPKVIDVNGRDIELNRTISETTYRDNAFITDEDIAKIKAKGETDQNFYRVYFLGEWGVPAVNDPFIRTWHETVISEDAVIDTNLPLYISFDFNVNPMTATVNQFSYLGNPFYYTIDEFRIKNSSTQQVAEMIKAKYGHMLMYITGDASGWSRKTAGETDYSIIKRILPKCKLFFRTKKNPYLDESRTLSESIIQHHPNRKIHPKCEYLIEDYRLVEAAYSGDATGNSRVKMKKANDSEITHLLDCQRYADWHWHGDFIKKHMPRFSKQAL